MRPAAAAEAARGGVALSGRAKAMIGSTRKARNTRAVCQPKAAMKAWPNGAKMNWPSEPAAVAMPKAHERFSGGTRRPKAAITIVNEAVAMPDADEAGRRTGRGRQAGATPT